MRLRAVEAVTDDWFALRKYHVEHTRRDGAVEQITRFSLHRGDRAAVLLHSPRCDTVVLTRQFRLPALLDGRPDGALPELPGGLLDGADAQQAVRREAEEETGFRVRALRFAYTVYLSPQLSRERTHLFTGEYDPADRTGPGGGLADEGEEIEVLQLSPEKAFAMATSEGPADAKTLLMLQLLKLRDRGQA